MIFKLGLYESIERWGYFFVKCYDNWDRYFYWFEVREKLFLYLFFIFVYLVLNYDVVILNVWKYGL